MGLTAPPSLPVTALMWVQMALRRLPLAAWLRSTPTTRGGPLGVVKADGSDPQAAIGVISYRLGMMKEGNVDKTYIDATASSVRKGDRAYITILGRVKMKLGDSAKVGSRLTLDANGTVAVAGKDSLASFGKVASQPDKDGYAYVLVNFK